MEKIRKDIFIAMTTRGRVNDQRTLKRLCPEVLSRVTLFCHPGELKDHEKDWKGKVRVITEYDSKARHMGEIREWIAANAPDNKVIFMDDNISFSVRQEGAKTPRVINKNNFSEEEIRDKQIELFNWLWDEIDKEDVGVAAPSFRPFNRAGMPDFEFNKRFFGLWAVDTSKYYKQHDLLMMDWPIKEDFIVGIATVGMGYKISITNRFAFDKCSGANSKGGCSIYRNVEMSNNICKKLHDMFPDFISLKSRKPESWGGDFENQESLEVIVYWSKIPSPLD